MRTRARAHTHRGLGRAGLLDDAALVCVCVCARARAPVRAVRVCACAPAQLIRGRFGPASGYAPTVGQMRFMTGNGQMRLTGNGQNAGHRFRPVSRSLRRASIFDQRLYLTGVCLYLTSIDQYRYLNRIFALPVFDQYRRLAAWLAALGVGESEKGNRRTLSTAENTGQI